MECFTDPMFDLNSTLGALEIGIIIATFLFGCVTIQSYTYYCSFPKDPLLIKILVGVTWLIQLGIQVTSSHSQYGITVSDWGRPFALLSQPKEIISTFFLSMTITPIVETFYLFRIYRFAGRSSRSSVYTVGLGFIIVLGRFACWLVLCVAAYRSDGLLDGSFINGWSWLIILQLSLGALTDATISSILVYLLWKKKDEGVAFSARIIQQLVKWTIQTGFVASAVFLISLVSFLFRKENLIWLAILMVLPKVFSNCLLASLNSRQHLQQMMHQGMEVVSPPAATSIARSDPWKFNIKCRANNLFPSCGQMGTSSPTGPLFVHISQDVLQDDSALPSTR